MLLKRPKPQEGRRPIAQIGKPKTVFSYYAGDKHDSGPIVGRHKAGDKAKLLAKFKTLPVVVVAGLVIFSLVFNTTLSASHSVKFVGETFLYRPQADYGPGIKAALGASILNKSKITMNAGAVQKSVQKDFPELDSVSVSIPIVGRRPTVTIHARAPAMILTNTTNSYLVDVYGKVVGLSNQLVSSQREKLLTVQDQSGLDLRVGSQALTASMVNFISNVRAQLADKKLVVTQMTLPAIPNEVDIRIKDQAYYIKANTSGDARVQMGGFLAARSSGAVPAEYMDVRVEEKVFYK